jgi:UDP-N-acetylmuramoyl-L-alanyl-D-glutamate--2,6-diaminopimelate ligase
MGTTAQHGIPFAALYSAASQAALVPELATTSILRLALDSRDVERGTLFFALLGSAPNTSITERHSKASYYIQQAIAQGAAVVLSEVDPALLGLNLPHLLHVADLRARIGAVSRRFNQLTQPLPTITRVAAVTGTNGKTTVTRLIAELLTLSGQSSAVLGTTGNGILPNLTPSTHTTLDALLLQSHLHDYAAQGAKFALLEASSHGLEQHRLTGTPIEVAIFTNLTRDHLDYHGTFEAYAEAKARLFDPNVFPELRYAIVNADDPAYVLMLKPLGKDVAVWRYSTQTTSGADFYVLASSFSLKGAQLSIQTPRGVLTVQSPLLGRFNVANLLAAIAGGFALGLSLNQISAAIPQLVGAAGRMQLIADDDLLLIVDYAHTPDAISQVLASLRPHTAGRLTCVVGCGGDRDRGKRPLMTRAALEGADQVIITADNPRGETVDDIIADMLHGLTADDLTKIIIEPDRRMAIRLAVRDSRRGDAVVIAGKGHENYQEISGVRHWFDDAVELQQARAALHPLPASVDATVKP